jgi:integrase
LSHWWPDYLRAIELTAKPSTVANYEQAWRLRIEPHLGSIAVSRIKPSHVESWVADLQTAGASASKVIETHGVLKRVLDRAVMDRAIPSNPCVIRTLRLPRRPTKNRPVLSPREVEELASAMKTSADQTMVRLLAYGGLRIGEALALRRHDVDIRRRTLTIRESVGETNGHLVVGPTKTYAVRTITLPTFLVGELAALLKTRPTESAALVFATKAGGHRRYRVMRRDSWDPGVLAMNEIRASSEREPIAVTPHDLRATCASLLVDAGASVKDVQMHLGHKDITTTLNLYARVRPERSADLAIRMDALITEANAQDEDRGEPSPATP